MGLLGKASTANPPERTAGAQVPASHPEEPAGMEAVREMIRAYWLHHSSCQGIVLEPPNYPGEAALKQFFAAAVSAASSFGKVICLPSKNILILFSKTLDRELLTHRLTRTLRARALTSFEAESPEEVLSRIPSCRYDD
ncbi:MAG: hypothetical protein LBE17_09900 [Treponema sp.]|jgi:hypothetical protein|nr:hypothetical protein [Treponema sp.]